MYPVVFNLTDLTDHVVQFVTNTVNVSPLVQNGGFETGNFTGWTLNGNPSPDNFVTNGAIGIPPHAGSYLALFGQIGGQAYLSQTVPTVGGQKYLLSLWLYNPVSAVVTNSASKKHPGTITNDPNEFSVSWNGQTLYDQPNLAAFAWSNMQFVVTATTANTVLKIGGRDDDVFLGLDDVSVAPASGPLFFTQPTNQTVFVGAQVVFPVNVYGTGPFTYQWYQNGAALSDGAEISGSLNSTLTLSGVTTNDAGNYTVVVTNIVGVSTSSVALLQVLPLPTIQVATTNTGAGFSFNFSGPPGASYILEATTNLASPWQPIATNAFGTNGLAQFTETQAANFRGRFYRVEVVP
jgi:hypothetical protein